MFFFKFNKFKLLQGYKNLKKNNFKNILQIRFKIEDKFQIKKFFFLHKILIKNIDLEDFIKNLKSNFVYENLDYNFNKEILLTLSGKKFSLAAPNEMTSILEKENYKLTHLNIFFWKFHLILRILKQYLKIFYKIKTEYHSSYKIDEKCKTQKIYIRNQNYLTYNFWMGNHNQNQNQNNIYWILKNFNADKVFLENTTDCNIFFNNKNISINSYNIFKFKNLFDLIKFLFCMHCKFFICLILIFTPFWYFTYNFYKLIENDAFHLNSQNWNIKEAKFFFDNNYMFDQPLWILSKDIKKNNIFVYFVSSNFDLIYLDNQDEIPYSGYRSLNWDNFIVWDKRQKEIVSKNIDKQNVNFLVKEPIPNFPLVKSTIKINTKKFSRDKKNILIFDVQPYRFGRFIYLGMPNEYYTFENTKKFYNDILSVTDYDKCKLFFKKKRDSKNIDKKYNFFLENLKSKNIINEIHHDSNIFEIFQNDINFKAISMPFTGPSYVADYFNIKSCFYDPTGSISNDYSWNLNTIFEKKKLKEFIND